MTYRTTPTTGDKVSLLGYGCMRWFTLRDKKTGIIDQERVNWLVDYAIEHGVNYFDTAPVYCDGECERVTGIALNRHPRDKYYIAAKISNLEPDTWSREETLKMYNNSFKELQVDYIDYLLLHGVGMGGMEEIEGRFLNNGVLDHLLEERKKGRIRNLGFSFHGDVKIFDYLLSLHDEGKYTWDFVQIQLNYVDWRHIAAILKQRRPDLSIASWAFRFAGTHPMVLSVLSGMPYMEHLKENIETYSPLEPLTQDDMDFLDSTAQKFVRYPLIPCNDCKYCMPCPQRINIPKQMTRIDRFVESLKQGKEFDDKTNYLWSR